MKSFQAVGLTSFLVNGEATAIEAKVNARKLLCLNESDLLEKVSHLSETNSE